MFELILGVFTVGFLALSLVVATHTVWLFYTGGYKRFAVNDEIGSVEPRLRGTMNATLEYSGKFYTDPVDWDVQ